MSLEWRPSRNHAPRPAGMAIDTIVLHATVLESIEEVCRHFEGANPGVASHYTIDRDGRIYQHVEESEAAFHAGASRMPDGRDAANQFSIGIELVNRNDGLDTYPSAQVDALMMLIGEIRSRHEIRYLVGHNEIAIPAGRKSDPMGFDVNELRGRLGLK